MCVCVCVCVCVSGVHLGKSPREAKAHWKTFSGEGGGGGMHIVSSIQICRVEIPRRGTKLPREGGGGVNAPF